jgi:hypothetical protein
MGLRKKSPNYILINIVDTFYKVRENHRVVDQDRLKVEPGCNAIRGSIAGRKTSAILRISHRGSSGNKEIAERGRHAKAQERGKVKRT